ncbi:MAG: leucine-rich repeat domain-containing protein [Candidatus Thorarchaeota archaeon]
MFDGIEKEFKVNEYITVKLENNKTEIYVNKKKFNQCKKLLLNTPIEGNFSSKDILSTDELEERWHSSIYHSEPSESNIPPPKTAFWGYCSNLQAWVENEYDTRLLNRRLAFSLLKKLIEAGDLVAKKVFKEEVIKRLKSGYSPVIKFLVEEKYLDYLSYEEIKVIFPEFVEYKSHLFPVIDGFLNLHLKGIEDLSKVKGLENLPSLTSLGLGHNFIREIKGLEKVPNLIGLGLPGNSITELKGLENLINLTELYLKDNNIQEIKELDNLINLEILDLHSNNIRKIKGLENLVNLKELCLYSNQITEIKGLDNLINLEILDLHANNIGKITGLENLVNLKELCLYSNQITEIKGLDNLINLEILDLHDNNIGKITGLEDLVNLKELYLFGNQIPRDQIENYKDKHNLRD